MNTTHTHTPGPWEVMPCPINQGKHPFHDSRWIATAGTEPEFGHDPRSWGIKQGHLICEMRDGPPANARLIAAAPDMLDALERALAWMEQAQQALSDEDPLISDGDWRLGQARAAIAKAKGIIP